MSTNVCIDVGGRKEENLCYSPSLESTLFSNSAERTTTKLNS